MPKNPDTGRSKDMTINFVHLDTPYKAGRFGDTRYIAFDFAPEGRAKMVGIGIRDIVVAEHLRDRFIAMVKSFEEEKEPS